jgi:hypothetical protein
MPRSRRLGVVKNQTKALLLSELGVNPVYYEAAVLVMLIGKSGSVEAIRSAAALPGHGSVA